MRFSPYSRIIQQGIRAANYGVLPDYTDVLLDPVQKAMAEIKYGAKGTHQLLEKFRQRDEPPKAFYEMKDFSPFEKLKEQKQDFTKQKLEAETEGLEVLKVVGYHQFFDKSKSEQKKESVNFYCLRNPETKYEIHFTFENNEINFMNIGETVVIHLMLIFTQEENQGNFFAMNRLLKAFKRIFLDGANLPYAYGRSFPDNQWNVRKKPNGNGNWRKDVKQIKNYNNGKMTKNAGDKLTAMYLRCGFVYPAFEKEDYPTIYYLSDNYKKRILSDPEDGAWLKERLKYSKYEK